MVSVLSEGILRRERRSELCCRGIPVAAAVRRGRTRGDPRGNAAGILARAGREGEEEGSGQKAVMRGGRAREEGYRTGTRTGQLLWLHVDVTRLERAGCCVRQRKRPGSQEPVLVVPVSGLLSGRASAGCEAPSRGEDSCSFSPQAPLGMKTRQGQRGQGEHSTEDAGLVRRARLPPWSPPGPAPRRLPRAQVVLGQRMV